MLSFFEFIQRMDEELLKQINLMNAIRRSGVPPAVFSKAHRVMTINDFLQNPPLEAQGAYALGLSTTTGDLYFRIAKAFNMVPWNHAYEKVFGPDWQLRTKERDITQNFLSGLMKDTNAIVFFLPNDATKKVKWQRYTREEIEYFVQHPDQLSRVIFVLGTYDLIDSDDYDSLVNVDQQTGAARTYDDQERIMQDVLRNAKLHGKPGEPY